MKYYVEERVKANPKEEPRSVRKHIANSKGEYGRTPIFETYKPETLDYLLGLCADVNVLDDNGNTVLFGPAYSGCMEAITWLEEHGFTKWKCVSKTKMNTRWVNYKNRRDKLNEGKQTVLHRAAKRSKEGNVVVMTYLLKKFRDDSDFVNFVNAVDANNMRAIDVALDKKLDNGPKFWRLNKEGCDIIKALINTNKDDNTNSWSVQVDGFTMKLARTGLKGRSEAQPKHNGLAHPDLPVEYHNVFRLIENRYNVNGSSKPSKVPADLPFLQQIKDLKKAGRRLGEENSGTSGYLCLFIIIGLMATYLVARVFYRAYKTKRASRVDRAAESFSDACDSVAVQALDNIEYAC